MLRVGVLGPVTAWYGQDELHVGQPRQQAVLGILAMRANRVISRGELVDAVWGTDPPASAEGGIYTYVAGLRRIIEPGRSLRGPGRVLVSSGAGYVLHLVPGQPDAVAFEQQLARARQLRKSGDRTGAATALEGALGLWRGVAFAGVPGPFAETERARLAELRSTAAEERADVLLELGHHSEVVPDLTAMVVDHPLRERMRGLLMIALYRSGRPAEALRVFADGRRVLADELGIDPGTDLSRIHQQVLTSDPALSRPTARGRAVTADPRPRPGHRDQAGPDGAAAADRTRRKGATPGPRGSDGSSLAAPQAGSGPGTGPGPGGALSWADGSHGAPVSDGGPASNGGPASRGYPVPAQLPLDAQGFSGRQDELATLHAMLPPARPAATDEPVPVVIISGTAGVGKTALAIHFGRQVAKRFPDGQLYVNLRGRDPGTPPVEPGEALRFFLDAFGVPPYRIVASTDERAALYRSLVDGKRMLIVLDNASNAAQVRPLLPGSPGCLVVVTSRNQMTGLVAAEGAALVTLDVLSGDEAHEMLARRLGRERVEAEPEAADEIIGACAGLPLALSITVGRAAGRAKRPLAALAAELRDARGRLDALEEGDAATDVRAVLSWSYDLLSPAAARMFRLLGLHPGPDIPLSAAASLAGITRAEAGAALRELTRTHMVAERLPGRFTVHDLLRVYAADQAERHDSAADRDAAMHRVLDHYLHTAMGAAQRFSPSRSPLRLAAPEPGVLPADLADKEQALAWFDAEVRVLLALISYAGANGFDTHAWQIPWTLGPYFSRRSRWRDYVATQQIALAAARRLDDTLALAHTHYLLGHAQAHMDDYDAAEPNFRRALDLFRELGDRANEAVVLNGLSAMLEKQGHYDQALAVALDALRMLKAVGHWWTQASLENGVGWLYAHLGQYDEALIHCQRALSLHRESGNRGGVADTLDSLGLVYLHLGDLGQARACYEQAIDAYREIGAPFGEGNSLAGLGDVLLREGQPDAARAMFGQAAAVLDTVPHPRADEVRVKLRDLDDPTPPQT
ncbi:MAG TPA: BTAD domain-containing putative transcriptional regulator [Streptosporangiaceae bacterium]|nr:BTAD domain-containing putative transcriptional regulator [Streptosporangiaceae bacterium]